MIVCAYSDSSYDDKLNLYEEIILLSTLTDSGNIYSNSSQPTTQGCANFYSLKIDTKGVFSLSGKNHLSHDTIYQNISIEQLELSMKLTPDPTALFDHNLSAQISTSDNNLYLKLTQINLVCDDCEILNETCSTISGLCEFKLYFYSSGLHELLATALGYSKVLTAIVKKPILKLVLYQSSVKII